MDSIKFNPDNYTTKTLTVEGKSFSVKCYENIVYVSNPENANAAYEWMFVSVNFP